MVPFIVLLVQRCWKNAVSYTVVRLAKQKSPALTIWDPTVEQLSIPSARSGMVGMREKLIFFIQATTTVSHLLQSMAFAL